LTVIATEEMTVIARHTTGATDQHIVAGEKMRAVDIYHWGDHTTLLLERGDVDIVAPAQHFTLEAYTPSPLLPQRLQLLARWYEEHPQ
jgi:hypothetical protein